MENFTIEAWTENSGETSENEGGRRVGEKCWATLDMEFLDKVCAKMELPKRLTGEKKDEERREVVRIVTKMDGKGAWRKNCVEGDLV